MTDAPSCPGVAVIGCGAWGRNHVRTFNSLGVLAAVCDANETVAAAAAETAGVPARSLDEVLADDAIGAVVIAAPDALHAAIATRALQAGKHVLIEKPMSVSAVDAESLKDLAERAGKVITVGHILRYHAAFRQLQTLVTENALGAIRHMASKRYHVAPPPPRHALWDLGPHDTSMMLALAGRMPRTVSALAGAEIIDGKPQSGAIMLDFGDGLTGEIGFSAIHPVKLHQITVSGTEAHAVFEDSRPWEEKLALYRPGLDRPGEPPVRTAIALSPGEPLAEEARSFLAAIAGGPKPPSGPREGIAVVRVLEAAARSLETGRPESP